MLFFCIQWVWYKDPAGQADDEAGAKTTGGQGQECEGGDKTAGHRGVQMGGPGHQTHPLRPQACTGEL